MTKPAEPDPLVAVLVEIRDVLVEIRDAVRPKETRMAEAMRPTSSAPRKRPAQDHIIG